MTKSDAVQFTVEHPVTMAGRTFEPGEQHEASAADLGAMLAAASAAGVVTLLEGGDGLVEKHVESDEVSLAFQAKVAELKATLPEDVTEPLRAAVQVKQIKLAAAEAAALAAADDEPLPDPPAMVAYLVAAGRTDVPDDLDALADGYRDVRRHEIRFDHAAQLQQAVDEHDAAIDQLVQPLLEGGKP